MPRPLAIPPLGGYIPFVNLPCERDIGESIKWVIVLSVLPLNCQLIPWMCCPLPFDPDDSEIAISTDITCDDPRAPIGAMIHWSMVGVSIVGLILSLLQVGECALVLTGVLEREIPTTIILEVEELEQLDDPFTDWFDAFEKALQDFQTNHLIYNSNYDADHKLIIPVTKDQISITGILSLLANPSIVFPQGKSGEEKRHQVTEMMKNLSLPLDSNLKDTELSNYMTDQEIDALIKKVLPDPDYVDETDTGITEDPNVLVRNVLPEPEYVDDVEVRTAKKFRPPVPPALDIRNSSFLRRVKRQALLDVPIPVIRSFYAGQDEAKKDGCPRNEVMVDEDDNENDDNSNVNPGDEDDDDDDDCYEVLSRGPCEETEIVLMDPVSKKGFCGPRLCSPDRVFLFSDQLCHDPHEIGLCPAGRQLFSSGFGTPVCGCEDGFYEKEDDDDDDDEECQPLLTEIPDCPPGKVFWFSSFSRPPQCLPDPCKGLNLNRRFTEQPFAPALADGKCYQIGSQPHICRSDQYFSLDLPRLKGVCQTIEDAGYVTLDSESAKLFRDLYGAPLSKDSPVTPLPLPPKRKPNWPDKLTPAIGVPVVPPLGGHDNRRPLTIGQPVVTIFQDGQLPNWGLKPTHVTAHSPPYIAVSGNVTINVFGGAGVNVIRDQIFPHSKRGDVFPHEHPLKFPRAKSASGFSQSVNLLQHGQLPEGRRDSSSPTFPPILSSAGPPRDGRNFGNPSTSSVRRAFEQKSEIHPSSSPTSSVNPAIDRGSERRPSFPPTASFSVEPSTEKKGPTNFSFPPTLPSRDNRPRRRKRSPLLHASPSNVFESALTVCRAGAARDINQKCRETILPSREPYSRPRRTTRPVRAAPSCPQGSLRDVQRRCDTDSNGVQNSIIAMGLG
ncbi:hypothetical protein FHG87_002178 [Trinorchestia longiramus]|nr:hypothetical protein FHG87_002178 [Trinorchestia longiramus]